MSKQITKQIELLEMELTLIQDNIKRMKDFQKERSAGYNQYNSHVVGEFKHRCVTLKRRLTIASRVDTYNLLTK